MDRVVHTLPPKNKVSTPLVSYYVLRWGFRLGLPEEISSIVQEYSWINFSIMIFTLWIADWEKYTRGLEGWWL